MLIDGYTYVRVIDIIAKFLDFEIGIISIMKINTGSQDVQH